VYEIEYDPSFHSQVDVEVAQSDVEVDDTGGAASFGKASGEGGGGGGFSDSSLAGGDAYDASSGWILGVVHFGGVGEYEWVGGCGCEVSMWLLLPLLILLHL